MGFSIWQLLIFLALLPLAFLPTIIALKINHPYKIAIILVNVLGGLFMGIGWLVALVWCFIVPNKPQTQTPHASDEIEKLHSLFEKGVLTKEEFESKKRMVLQQ